MTPPSAFPRKRSRVERPIVRPVEGGPSTSHRAARHVVLLGAFLAWTSETPPATAVPASPKTSSASRESAVIAALTLDPTVRLSAATEPLLGARYVLSPLGEGEGIDPDPRFRLDAFDCTTFVETALALASSSSLDTARARLDQIRYADGEALFEKRRHLVTSQWVPGIVKLGLLEDVTTTVAKERTEKIALVLTPKRWKKRWVARTLALDERSLTFGEFEIPILPLEAARDVTIEARIPTGTVVNVVRAPYGSAPDFVTHQGIVLVDPKNASRRIVRHASPVRGRVVDEPFEKLVRRYARPRKWAVVGLQFLEVKLR